MRIACRGAAIAAIGVLGVRAAAADIQILEDAVETTASAVVLPSAPPSSLVVTPCSGCTPLHLLTSAQTQYFIGKAAVELAELRSQLSARPNTLLVIIYDRRSRELRRIRAFLPPVTAP